MQHQSNPESSNISEEGCKSRKSLVKRKASPEKELQAPSNLSKNISRPKNQHRERAAPKFNSDAKSF